MKISIITAVYNRQDTIEQAVKSVQSQRYNNVEHVIIDGASTDGTLEILQKVSNIKTVLVSESDNGIYDALNKGIALATGDIVGFLHSDDIYKNELILTDIAKAFSNPEIDIVYGDVTFHKTGNPDAIIRRYRSGEFSAQRLSWGWMPAHPATFIRRSVYEKYGVFKTSFKIAADYEFFCRLMVLGDLKSLYLPRVLIKMQIGGISTGGLLNTFILNREVVRACKENGISTNFAKILTKYPLKIIERVFR